MAAATSWNDVLDRFEASLDGYGDRLAELDQGSLRPVIPSFEPPIGLGSLPPSLLPRARRLALLATRLEAQLRADLDRVGVEIRARTDAGRRRPDAGAEPVILDRSA